MTVEHTVRFTAARVLLQRPRQGAWDLGAWDDPVWINVWTNVNHRGEPRGFYFCAVAPMDRLPAWEAIEGQDEEVRDEEMRGPPALPPPWQVPGAAPAEARPARVAVPVKAMPKPDPPPLPAAVAASLGQRGAAPVEVAPPKAVPKAVLEAYLGERIAVTAKARYKSPPPAKGSPPPAN